MSFLCSNIDRAIVMTQSDLRGFNDPLGFRHPRLSSAKILDAITCNLIAGAAGITNALDSRCTVENYVAYHQDGPFESYLAMCRELAACCDISQKEAIQLIVQEIVKQHDEMDVLIAAGTMQPSAYLKPLAKNNRWGRAILALVEAFDIALEQTTA